ncbi:menaquinone biosynthesis prenyltransferase MqnP [Campylobacter sp. 19-13652]|uniref:menaquinone biosynthesis prenyltransferase MqnP n=1 Tax=Campylobacter sp. 19-13652 TaxID=2840180 RepID=UPI001C76E094|nr:menaquinone biosynthesis prenyltransferase MqnP [Campylobacter sp. 19-13652]BCX80136.1 4-hydroxybenzoate octaprenyltransferase [Campylobacter sp. 19-13652]
MQKIITTLRDLGELIAFKHSIFALPFIFIAMLVASFLQSGSAWFGFRLLVLGILCAVSARNFAMLLNRYLDRDIDAANERTKDRPSVDGRVSGATIFIFTVSNALIFILCSWAINSLAFALSVPFLAVLGGYSFFKRFSSSAHIILGLSLGLAPIAGVVAVSASIPLWAVLLGLGVLFWVAGFDLLYSLQDMEFDRKAGLYSVPSIYGEAATMALSRLFHALTVLFWLLFAWAAGLGVVVYAGVGVSAVILFFEHRIVACDFTKIDKAFFTLNGWLGIIFFAFVLWGVL